MGMLDFSSVGSRDLDFSVPELRLLQDNNYQDQGDYLRNDMNMHMDDVMKIASQMKQEGAKSPKRKRPEPNSDCNGMTTMADLAPPPLNSSGLFPLSFLGHMDGTANSNTPKAQESFDLEFGSNSNSNKPLGAETSEEKQERIRRRNREHARKCRIRKRQAADNLAARVKQLEEEYGKLMKAFRLVYNSKALMDSLVVSEFGSKGSLIVERTNKLALVSDRADILSAASVL